MSVKRLLCIVGGMNVGGAETFLMKVYRQLDREKYQMDFAVAIEEEGYYDQEILSMGGKIYHITPKSKGFIKNFNSIRKIVQENQYRYVLRTSQNAMSAMELFAAMLGGAKVRVFRSSNSNTMREGKERLVHKLCGFMPQWFANVRIAPSTLAADFMFGKNSIKKGNATLLHNAVDLNYYRFDMEARCDCRKELGVQDELLVGHIGRFNQQKNHLFLIEVFYHICKKCMNAKLVLVGQGETEEQVRAKVEELGLENRVIFTGVRSDIPQLMSAMDVFVFPSFYEGMPNTVIEAQAAGLPCLIADTITPEAKVTPMVNYASLHMSAEQWATLAVAMSNEPRVDAQQAMKEHGYDIHGITVEFMKLLEWS